MAVRFVTLVLAAMVALAGCGSGVVTDPAANTSTGMNAPGSTEGPPPPPGVSKADPSLLPILTTSALTSAPDKITTAVPNLANARAFNEGMWLVRGAFLRAYSWGAKGEFVLDWNLVAASQDTIGVLLQGRTVRDGKVTVAPASVWFDATTNRVASGAALIKPGSWGAFTAAVVASAKDAPADKLKEALASEMAPRGNGPALAFSSNGDLLVDFGIHTVSQAEGTYVVRLKADQVSGWLSGLGLRAKDASAKPSAFNPATITGPPKPEPETAANAATPSASAKSPAASAAASGTPSAGPAPVVDDRPNIGVVPDCRKLKCAALTFDDGPYPTTTGQVLAGLTKGKVSATFFALGTSISGNKGLLLKSALAGYDIQSHSSVHDMMTKKSDAALKDQITKNSDAIRAVTGYTPWLLRPPYGDRNARVNQAIGAQAAAVAIWDVDTEDWKTKNGATTAARAAAAKPGDIVLMHDIQPSTANAIDDIVGGMTKNGLTVVSMAELVQPGAWQYGVPYCAAIGRASATC